VIDNGQTATTALFAETKVLLDSLGIARQSVQAGDTLGLGEEISARVLGPVRDGLPEDEANNASVVLLVRFGETELLFAGDAEREAEAEMLTYWADATREDLLRADVVKVGHHGSRTSSTPAWVDAVAEPGGVVVVSVARRNVYNLPGEEVLERWQAAGADVHLTHRGALWLRSDGRSLVRVGW
jgi:competence protein ComEC